ncbi:DUF4270 domain-containing protein [Flavobacterium sp.]|uniref:DUF4270 domain-containing protein n=1 Tax=Flavobacterium sp. TaxID=239 RepID=UPI003D09A0C5
MKYNWIKKVALVLTIGTLISCDKDYNTIGSELLGTQTFDFLAGEDKSDLVSFENIEASKVQTNNLLVNQLGVYPNEDFGTTEASFVSQLTLAEKGVVFDKTLSPSIDSVVLSLPYFSTKLSTDSNGKSTYRLDSIFTNKKDYYTDYSTTKLPKIKLEVFRNNFALNDFDANNPHLGAKYYSDQTNILSQVGEKLANVDLEFNQAEFEQPKVDANNVLLDIKGKPDNVQARYSPRVRIKLDKDFFSANVLNAPKSNLANDDAFVNNVRGITLKASQIGVDGALAMLDFKKADVTIYYKQKKAASDLDNAVKDMKTFVLKLSGNSVNIRPTVPVVKDPSKVYLKGGQGSIATLLIKDELINELKAKKGLLNDASLYLTVDPSFVAKLSATGSKSFNYLNPMRLYLFDYDNKTSLVDYFSDNTTVSSFPKKNKVVFGGQLLKVGDKYMYRIRITDHLNRLLTNTTGAYKNVKLGLAITEDIRLVPESLGNLAFSTAFVNGKESFFPMSSVLNPLGTILGGTTGADKIQLKISYTKPN